MIETRQFYPSLDTATEAALRESIRRFGVLVPPMLDQHGVIVDGHHRVRIATELGVPFEPSRCHVASEEEAREIARTLNEDRRMLTREQRLPVVAALRETGHSLRAIGGALGVSKSQAKKDVDALEVSTSGHLPAATTGLDGKTYPASKPKPAANGNGKHNPVPTSLDTERQRSIATTAKERVEKAVGTCNGIARGFDLLNVKAAAMVAEPDELQGWHDAAREAIAAMRRLQTRIREAQP